MTVALIADNHLALDPLIQARLKDVLPPGTIVGGFVEYLELLSGKASTVPAAFAVYAGDRMSSGTGSPHQTTLAQAWQVVIVTAPGRTPEGGLDMAETGGLMAQAIKGLSGYKLHESLKPLARVDDTDPLRHGNGLLFAFLAFSQPLDMR